MKDQLTQLEQKETLENARRLMELGLNTFWVINAVLTAVYGGAVVYLAFDYPTLSNAQKMGVIALMLVGMFTVCALTDGARYVWNQGRIASGSSASQQRLAKAMEIFSFILSLIASVVALRFVFSLLGVGAVTGVESSHETMITIFSVALITHIAAGFWYVNLSPQTRQLAALSAAHADLMDDLTLAMRLTYQNVRDNLPNRIGEYQREIEQRIETGFLSQSLLMLGHGEIQDAPQHVELPRSQEQPTVKARDLALEMALQGGTVWNITRELKARCGVGSPDARQIALLELDKAYDISCVVAHAYNQLGGSVSEYGEAEIVSDLVKEFSITPSLARIAINEWKLKADNQAPLPPAPSLNGVNGTGKR